MAFYRENDSKPASAEVFNDIRDRISVPWASPLKNKETPSRSLEAPISTDASPRLRRPNKKYIYTD